MWGSAWVTVHYIKTAKTCKFPKGRAKPVEREREFETEPRNCRSASYSDMWSLIVSEYFDKSDRQRHVKWPLEKNAALGLSELVGDLHHEERSSGAMMESQPVPSQISKEFLRRRSYCCTPVRPVHENNRPRSTAVDFFSLAQFAPSESLLSDWFFHCLCCSLSGCDLSISRIQAAQIIITWCACKQGVILAASG